MSQERGSRPTADDLPEEGQQALSALRNVWSAKDQGSETIDASCGTSSTACKNVETNVGFQGLVDDFEMPSRDNPSVSGNLRSAWKTKLEREGKVNPEATSVKDIIFGSTEPAHRESVEKRTEAEQEATRTSSYPTSS